MEVHLCPNCHGQKTVSKPPHLAGDILTWTANENKTYPCPTCNAMGYIVTEETVVITGTPLDKSKSLS